MASDSVSRTLSVFASRLWPVVATGSLAGLAYQLSFWKETAWREEQCYKLTYTVLTSHLEETKNAIFEVDGGTCPGGKYRHVAFEIQGKGQFIPDAGAGAIPHTGTPGMLERTEEVRVEILCVGKTVTKASVEALKRAHPYEVCAYEVFKVEDF